MEDNKTKPYIEYNPSNVEPIIANATRRVSVSTSALFYVLGWASDKSTPELVQKAIAHIRQEVLAQEI